MVKMDIETIHSGCSAKDGRKGNKINIKKPVSYNDRPSGGNKGLSWSSIWTLEELAVESRNSRST